MFLINALMEDISVGTAGLVALLGYAVVFIGLIALMVVVMIMGKVMSAKKTAPAAAPTAVAAGEVVAAPMPGNILKVNCSQGQAVKAGDILVVLEAMKMENEILAPRDGTVAQVVTTKGAVVDTGAPLVVLA